ncbi:SPOR domain-containing protein [Tenacibaculum retecalamus]|uniref:SPOR domain-containing protein n=1 Tax=Tenacibaculum retecalamus TaxID=3018315 RepID=UPI0023D922C5|nr:SPOR domain-containing protein [Tenacibaculum retecalamus]WBX72421.1 SPOR domain-containing protein [Tenacibaculum retecalamus]
MPFIEEEKFTLMQEDLDNAKLKREAAENELTQAEEKITSLKKGSMMLPIMLGLLLGASLGAAYYFYANNSGVSFPSSEEIATIKKSENIRILDSIKRANARTQRKVDAGMAVEDLNKTIDAVADNISDKPIYSVQIGVFSEKNHSLISTATIPSTVTIKDGYFKYSIGLFESLDEAKSLREELIKIGFKDAFVASYINGERQKIHP